jgi:hypothetical protein
VVRGAIASILFPLRLTASAIDNRSDHLLTEAWLVAMSRSTLVVRGCLRPNLWTRDS